MKLSNILKTCLNYKVILGALAGIVLIYILAPRFANFSWILIALICPVSMVLMMASMQRGNEHPKDTDHENDHKQ